MDSDYLGQLIRQAQMAGWATGNGDLGCVTDFLANSLGWNVRLTGEAMRCGTWLHSDGAHHRPRPDILLFSAGQAMDGPPLLLWAFTSLDSLAPKQLRSDLNEGLFTVRNRGSKETFLSPAHDSPGVRFDPVYMEPADQRASRVAAYFGSSREHATRYEWEHPHQILAIANKRVLHARESPDPESQAPLRRVALGYSSKDQP